MYCISGTFMSPPPLPKRKGGESRVGSRRNPPPSAFIPFSFALNAGKRLNAGKKKKNHCCFPSLSFLPLKVITTVPFPFLLSKAGGGGARRNEEEEEEEKVNI